MHLLCGNDGLHVLPPLVVICIVVVVAAVAVEVLVRVAVGGSRRGG